MADTGRQQEVSLATLGSAPPPATATVATTTAAPTDPGPPDTGQEKPGQNTESTASAAPMGECSTEYRGLPGGAGDGGASLPALRKVSIVPLVFLIFYEVSGGPFGIEDSVGAAGPLLAIVGFLVLPVIWSIPEVLITAELGTMFPENGGYVVWVSSALGPYWGFQQGWMKWLSGVIDNALYPVRFLDYLKSAVPALGGGAPRAFAVVGLTALLTLMNYRGLTVVARVAICLGVFSLLPFLVMGLVALPKLRPARWLVVDLHNVDWNLYLCWHSASPKWFRPLEPKPTIESGSRRWLSQADSCCGSRQPLGRRKPTATRKPTGGVCGWRVSL